MSQAQPRTATPSVTRPRGVRATERFDVVIVGAACAGAPLAALLARQGLDVVLVDKSPAPKGSLSSHLMEADCLAFLNRLGVIERVRETGAPFMRRIDLKMNDCRFEAPLPQVPGDVGGAAFVRRHLLDPILVDAAREAGADVRMGTKVTSLVERGGRVRGACVEHDGSETEIQAGLVVGADGRGSAVAKLVGAREYGIIPSERWYYWTFFEGAHPSTLHTFVYHRWDDRMIWAGGADSGLYLIGTSPGTDQREAFKRDPSGWVRGHALACEPTAMAIRDARQATKIYGIKQFSSYFRQACGPGWVLAGDAGHFKDPSLGRGIGDAFRQADALAPAIVAGLGGSAPLDRELAEFARWRDGKFFGHQWIAGDLGGKGRIPDLAPEAVRHLHSKGRGSVVVNVFNHRSTYEDVFGIPRGAGAAVRLLLRSSDRRALLRDFRWIGVREVRRRGARRLHRIRAAIQFRGWR
jgi:2-polyprenyl-6-methoxyphenol hydroxylase-like FAD-dependent oxidoreductase